MPLDENFPIFHFSHADPKRASNVTAIANTIGGSSPNPVYTFTRAPSGRNTYAAHLTDALFPSITYATLSAQLEIPPASPGTPTTDPKVLLPAEFTMNLYNPDSSVTFELHASTLRGNYWEFTLPKRSFHPPSNSQIDAHYDPIPSERLTFRWRKEGGALTRKQLRCSLVSPGNLPGPGGKKTKKGAGEPDIPVAMFEGLGEKSGRGELTVYESNFRRVEVEDLKGLEMVLVMGAKVINDVFFCRTREMFNTEGEVTAGVGRPRGGSAVAVPQIQPHPQPQQNTYFPQHQSPQQHAHPQSFAARVQQQQQQQEKQRPPPNPHQPQPHPQSFAARAKQSHSHPTPVPSAASAERIAQEQAQIRAMLAREEADRITREQVAINAETERLRRLYHPSSSSQRRSSHPLPGSPTALAPPDMPMRPNSTVPTQGRRRPPVVGGGGGMLTVPGMASGSAVGSGGNGLKHARRKSFLGLFGMEKQPAVVQEGAGKLRKKGSFWA